ncbi:hypothetical protein [Nereida ignava]|uniref:50S ribosomal protein L35 n=1 Tax=Nereida ignava TaxID=282199 RepID=A0A0U1NL44_9RHOB|nr:hypothetical protein [Nereida ignava]CRK75446.1 hypothetical protein NIG5292_01493 [Nereida ignava]SFJ52814.1 hypothetical protein SAMN02745667_01563 [Nereida ignava DSM 16309]
MQTDFYFVLGLVFAVLAVPSIFSAYAEGRSPRLSALLVLISGGLLAYAVTTKPGGYEVAEIPSVVIAVIGQLLP